MGAASGPAAAQTASGTYVTQPTTGSDTNTVGNDIGSSSIAIGVAAHASSSSLSGDQIAIGSDVNATKQDSIAIGAQTTASGVNTIAIGNAGVGIPGFNAGTSASADNSIAFGTNTLAQGNGAIAIGNGATASSVGSIALGFASQATRAGLNGTEAFSNTAVASPYGALSIGDVGTERQIANVAGGTQDTDAINVRQLRGAGNDLADSLGGGAGFDATTNAYTAPTYTVGGVTYHDVGSALAAGDNLAVQYTPDGSGNPTNAIDLTRGGTLQPVVLSGLGPGAIGSGSTDAINGSQIYGSAASVAQNFGGGATVNADGTLSAPTYNIQGTSYSNVGSALNRLDTAVTALNTDVANLTATGSRYVSVNSTGAPASATGPNATAIGPNTIASSNGGLALGSNASATRAGMNGTPEAFTGTIVASTEGAVSVGAVGSERQITNVAGGTQDTDAVNLRQLRGVGNDLAGSLGGGAGFNPTTNAYTAPTYTVNGTTYNNVGGAVAALDNTGVKYDVNPATGSRGNSVTLQGGDPNQPVLIRNVAAGQAPTDAANTGQVAAARADAFAYTNRSVATVQNQVVGVQNQLSGVQNEITGLNGQISDLQSQVGQVRTAAYQAAAIGLAAASLRYDDRPGRLSTSVGTGFWQGQSATAMGMGYSLPDGRARLNASAVTAGHDFGFGAGASFTLN